MTLHRPDRDISSPLDCTRETLESIKYTVEAAIQLLDDFEQTRSLQWKCENGAENIHDTRPARDDDFEERHQSAG